MASRPRNQPGRGGIASDRVLGQHRHDRVDVAALPGVDVALDDRAHLARRRARAASPAGCARAAARRPPCGRAAARCRPRPRSSRASRRPPRREAQHVAQDQHRALARRQVLQRGDERELDRLALLVAGLGPGAAVRDLERSSGTARPRPTRPAARRARRADRRPARSPAAAPASGRRSISRRQVLVAIRYSHERSELRPSKRGEARQARSSVPAARPRRPATSRASGSSGRAARRERRDEPVERQLVAGPADRSTSVITPCRPAGRAQIHRSSRPSRLASTVAG